MLAEMVGRENVLGFEALCPFWILPRLDAAGSEIDLFGLRELAATIKSLLMPLVDLLVQYFFRC
jgi:hypothetical protein